MKVENKTILYMAEIPVPFHCFSTCFSCGTNFFTYFPSGRPKRDKYAAFDQCLKCGILGLLYTSYITTAN